MSSKKPLLKIGDLYSDSSHERIAMCHSIFRKLKRKPTAGPEFLSQIIHWAKVAEKDGRESFYKEDKDWEINFPPRTLKRAKRIFKEENLVTITIKVINGKRVSVYQPNKKKLNLLEYEIVNPNSPPLTEIIENKVNNPENSKWHFAPTSGTLHYNPTGTFLFPKYTSGTFKSTQVALSYKDTISTTINTKINTYVFTKNELPNEPELGNLPNDQKSGSGETDLLGSGKIIPVETPTPNSEESNLERKAVGTSSNSPLKAEAVEAPKKSKGKGQVSKPKSNKVAKTPMNPEMELTAELRKIALDVRIEDRGLKEGLIESIFESFRDHYVANGVSRPRWDLSWKNWCRIAIEGDRFSTKSMVNPPRTEFSDKPAEEELPIDSAFEDFLKSNPDINKDYFRGATLQRGEKVIIWHSDKTKADYMDDRYCRDLRGYFGPDVMVKFLSEDVKKSTSTQPIQIQPTSAQPIQLPIDDFNVCLEKMRMSAIAKLAEIEDEEERFMKWNRLERDIKYVKNTYRINHDVLNIGLIAHKYGLQGLL